MDNEKYRSIITIAIPWDGPVEMEVEGGSVIEMFGAATMLERAAHKVLAQAERDAAIVVGSDKPDIVTATQMPTRLD
jgi:hypothetical protein